MRIQGCRSQGIDQGNQSIEQYLVSSDCIYTIEKNQRRGGKMGVDTTRYLQIHFALSKPIKPTWVETYQVMMDPAAVYPHVLETSCHTAITLPAHTGSSPSSRPAWSHTVQEASSDQSLLQSGRRARAKACRTRAKSRIAPCTWSRVTAETGWEQREQGALGAVWREGSRSLPDTDGFTAPTWSPGAACTIKQ